MTKPKSKMSFEDVTHEDCFDLIEFARDHIEQIADHLPNELDNAASCCRRAIYRLEQLERELLVNGLEEETVRQTGCKHCGLDIENISPYPEGEWRDRGNNTECPVGASESPRKHAPPD